MGKVLFIHLAFLSVIIACFGLPTGKEDELGTKSTKTKLASDSPKITYSKETRINVGEEATLDCAVENVDLSGLEDFQIQWNKVEENDGEKSSLMRISSNTKLEILSDRFKIEHQDGSYAYSLKIPRTVEEDSGTYRCSVVFGADQKVDADVPLLILKSAYFTDTITKVVEVEVGDAISIDCRPGGSPTPKVIWERIGQDVLPYYDVKSFESNRLDLPLVERAHKGRYACRADNGLGEPVTSEVRLQVNYKPTVILNHEAPIAASIIDKAQVKCSVEGLPTPTVHWEKSGHKLQPSSNIAILETKGEEEEITSDLMIKKLQLEDFAEYTCVAENRLGRTEKKIRIALRTPPKIEKQTVGEKIYQVSDYGRERSKFMIALECEGSGIPAPSYKWYKDGDILPWQADERMSLEPGTGTLVIQNPRKDDNGVYICSAFNDLGTARSDEIRLTNESSIEFIRKEPGDVTIKAEMGKPLHFTCPEVVGHPTPEVTWMKATTTEEGVEMNPIDGNRVTADSTGTLWFSHVTEEDDTFKNDFKYTCLASSELHPFDISLAKTVNVEVIEPPEGRVQLEKDDVNIEPFIMHSSTKKVIFKSGEEGLLECIVGGEPTPGVLWERTDGIEITEKRYDLKNYGQTLIFKDPQPEDAGEYTCLGYNIVGSTERKKIKVEVEVVPKFKSDFKAQAQIVQEGTTVTFSCDIVGEGRVSAELPQYDWFFNGRPLEIAEGSRRRLAESNLIITATRTADTGNYACKATNPNSKGYAYGQTTLNVIPREVGSPSTSLADSQVLQDIQQKVETLSSDVQTLKQIVQSQVKENKVTESMADLLNKIAQKVLGDEKTQN